MKQFFTNISLVRAVKAYEGNRVVWREQSTICRVDLEIDMDRLFRELGTNALNNKSKKSRGMSGAIIASVKVL